MLYKGILDKTKHYLGELTKEQEEILNEYLDKKINEPELLKKLGVAEEKFSDFMRAASKEKEVFY